jgi:hypothetical protein
MGCFRGIADVCLFRKMGEFPENWSIAYRFVTDLEFALRVVEAGRERVDG